MKEGVIPTHSETCPPFATEIPNTSVFILPDNREHLQVVLDRTLSLADTLSTEMSDCFKKLFDSDQSKRPTQSSHVWGFLESKKLNFPQFLIFDSQAGNDFLGAIKASRDEKGDLAISDLARYQDYRINQNGILLAFQFPKPISIFWRKKNHNLKGAERVRGLVKPTLRELRESIPQEMDITRKRIDRILAKREPYIKAPEIEWGRYIPPLRRILWRHIEQEQEELLEFRKINGSGDHEPTMYHYMWEVSLPTFRQQHNH